MLSWIGKSGSYAYEMSVRRYNIMRKPIQGKEDLVTWCKQNNKQFLLEEWDYERNPLNPEE